MCLSTQALVLFLSLLPPEIVTPSATDIVVAAEAGPVVWEARADLWCTTAPLTARAHKG